LVQALVGNPAPPNTCNIREQFGLDQPLWKRRELPHAGAARRSWVLVRQPAAVVDCWSNALPIR
jgi:hypothetical protein